MRFGFFSFLVAGLLAVGLFAFTSCSSQTEASVAEIKLPTIQCGMCVKTITKALTGVEGVEKVDVNLEGKTVKVTYQPNKASMAKLEQAVSKAGYDANATKADAKAYAKLAACCKVPEKESEHGSH